jgi:dienelactone hydrolase
MRAITSSLIAVVLCFACANATPLFDIDGAEPTIAIVSSTASPPAEIPDSPMLRELLGVHAVLEGRDLRILKAAFGRLTDEPVSGRSVRTLTLAVRAPHAAVRTLQLIIPPDAEPLAHDPATNETVRLDQRIIERLSQDWPPARPAPESAPDLPIVQVIDLPQPYTPSPISLNDNTIGERLFGGRGRPPSWQPMDRDLAEERFSVRLPRNHRPDRPSGLLIWSSPAPSGSIPPTLHPAADALNLICIGPHNAGNQRTGPAGDPADRFQLALDAVVTAADKWWVDRERVYITGLSGGGRITSMTWAAFPDVVTGAVPIVGINSPEAVPISRNTHSPGQFVIPGGELRKLLRPHRMAAITGTRDFNHPETTARVRWYKAKRYEVELYEVEGMEHEFPPDEVFLDALTWVDEPVRQRRTENEAEAAERVAAIEKAVGEGELDAAQREELVAVTRLAPWTAPAWRAAVLLGYAEE